AVLQYVPLACQKEDSVLVRVPCSLQGVFRFGGRPRPLKGGVVTVQAAVVAASGATGMATQATAAIRSSLFAFAAQATVGFAAAVTAGASRAPSTGREGRGSEPTTMTRDRWAAKVPLAREAGKSSTVGANWRPMTGADGDGDGNSKSGRLEVLFAGRRQSSGQKKGQPEAPPLPEVVHAAGVGVQMVVRTR
ncbi:MAG: hypothetical protein BJ554DRAFT_2807, partial [Olpidium bornovanus]